MNTNVHMAGGAYKLTAIILSLEARLEENDCDSDGLSLGVVKTVVGLDVENHAETPGEDERQNGSGENARPDRDCKEIAAVVSVVEPLLEVVRLNL
jgi:hypothetical protein